MQPPKPALPLLPNPRSKPKTFKSGEAANLHERAQFDSWSELFTAVDANGKPRRKNGSWHHFERFFEQMMPVDVVYTLEKVSTGSYQLLVYRLLPQDQENLRLFHHTGSLRETFVKLLGHYGKYRREYFEERYNTKYLSVSITQTIKKGLAPPPKPVIKKVEVPVEKIVEKEKIVTQEVPVPGPKVDVISNAMEEVYSFLTDHVSGHKRLPNIFRRIVDLDISTKMTGKMIVTLELGP